MEYKIILCIGMLLLLTGCTTKYSEEEINYDYRVMSQKAYEECESKRMGFASYEFKTIGSGMAVCYTESPMKVYRFQVVEE